VNFDEYASSYDVALGRGLAVSGEHKDYFARQRVCWLAERLRDLGLRPRSVLDFGCGTGSAIPFLLEMLAPQAIVGVDDSSASLEVAAGRCTVPGVRFMLRAALDATQSFDLVFCNGVFHHVVPSERPVMVAQIHRALRPGGVFALWENNRWSPAARYVMSRIAFDRDAQPMSAAQGRALAEGAGLQLLRTDFLFVFPRFLRRLRWLEPHLARWPLGAQYQVLSRRS
jgi:SAM-dependent methyltransferase